MSVQQALKASKRNISTSLRAVTPLTTNTQSTLPPILSGLPESLAQLLQQLHYQITSLSLSFKPPITAPAVLSYLEKLNESYGRIAACVVAATGGQGGGALVEEWKDGVVSIGNEVLRLLDVFEVAAERESRGEGSSKTTEENPYLVHTGLVWEVIDRLGEDLSRSEVDAVTKRWRGQGEVMKDAWTEFKEFLEEQDEDEDDGEDEDEDDGEDEDEDDFDLGEDDDFAELEGMMKGGKMTPTERARAEAAKSLFGLHQILQATLPRYLPLLTLDPEESYRPLLDASSSLSAAFDSAIGAMYPTQEKEEIEAAVKDLGERSLGLARLVRERLDRADGGDQVKGDACRSFLGKWEERLRLEEQAWREKGMSVSALGHALPE